MDEPSNLRLFWLKSPEERLKHWREIRKNYDFSSVYQLCNDIWEFWRLSPDVSKTLDPYTVKNWPTVWEIIYEGNTCKYSKSLAAAYSVYYINNDYDIVITRVYDKKNNDIYIASIIDEQYVFIPYSNEVENWQELKSELEIEEKWHISQVLDMVKNRTN